MLTQLQRQVGDALALLEVPVSGGQQVHVRVQEPGVAIHPSGGWGIPVDGQLHVGQAILLAAIARIDLKGIPVIPVSIRYRGLNLCKLGMSSAA